MKVQLFPLFCFLQLIFINNTTFAFNSTYLMDGCTDPAACNYDPNATVDDGNCVFELQCDDGYCSNGFEAWNPLSCDCDVVPPIFGCTDPGATNFDPIANCDVGECYSLDYGCTDPTACNYNPAAWEDDGSCVYSLDCDDGDCTNGIEYFDITTCDCMVAPGCEYQITSITPTACPPDTLSPAACNNVCPFNSQVYVVDGYNGEIEWEVIGAESWEVIGSELLINWGGPGSGLITASGEGEDQPCNIEVSVLPMGCSGVIANGNTTYDYFWYNIFGNLVSEGQQFFPNILGEFILEVSDPNLNACVYSETITLPLESSDIEITGVIEPLENCDIHDGGIITTVAGGSPPYAYEWESGVGSASPILSELQAGIYNVTVYDSNGCFAQASFPVSCGQQCDDIEIFSNFEPCGVGTGGSIGGSIAIEAPPGLAYTITGPGGFSSGSPTLSNLDAGTYYVFVTNDDNACVEVVELGSPLDDLSISILNESECGFCDGQLNFSNSSNLSFEWSNGNTGSSNQGLCVGTYSVQVYDNVTGEFCEHTYTISCENGGSSSFETSLCIDILEETEAIISTLPAAINGDVNICAGQTIYFESQSTNAETHIWDFGNGENDSGINTQFTYEIPGSYLVELIARNECLCSDTTTINVIVEQAIIPKLDCVGTICENTEVTYTTDADCNSYSWNIGGDGTITDGGGAGDDFVTINWGAGPLGTISLSVDNCTENYCIFENVSQIPIIGNNDNIKGATDVCRGDLEVYTITEYGGADFLWEVSQYGVIVEGQGTNTVSIQWTDLIAPLTPQWVRVSYDNCYLECGGSAELAVNILDEYFFSGPIELCLNENGFYEAEKLSGGPAMVNWEVKDAAGAVILTDGPSSQFNLTLSGSSGIYTLSATPADAAAFCSNTYSAFINLLDSPPPPIGILGDTEVCAGETYTYNVVSAEDNTSFEWEINDGGNISSKNGGFINIVWNSQGPYSLSVFQIENSDAACESESISINLTKIDDIVILGQQEHCVETTSFFIATNYPDVNYNWIVTPENAATIIGGQGENTVEVFWHTLGNVSIQLDACSNSDTYNVNVNPRPEPIINHPLALCPEGLGTVSTTIPYSVYAWRDTSGFLISLNQNPQLGPGNYELIVADEYGCEGNVVFEIEALPSPTVEISSPNLLNYCPPFFPVPTLYALESDPPYTYQWYRYNTLIPGATMSLYTPPSGESGNYYVEAVNEYGCKETSNVLNVVFGCGGGGPPSELQCVGAQLSYDITNTNQCKEHEFLNTSPECIPGTTSWFFGYPAVEGTASGESVSYEFQRAGFYYVVMFCDRLFNGVIETCGLGKLDMVPVSPDFHVLSNCVESSIEFEDLSTFVPGESVTSWTWDFGDPASGFNNTSTLQDPLHTFNTAGIYDVSLVITGPNGCTSEIIKSIEIQNPPTPTFDLPDEDCQQFPLDFVANVGPKVTDVFWDFGDPASGDGNTSEVIETYHEYDNPGTYIITLTALTIYGCEGVYTQQISIEPNSLSGTISMAPGSPICEDQTTTMTAPPAINYDWSNGETTPTITTGEAGVYDVTITDDNGCAYITPEVVLDVLPLPGGEIRVIEYDEYDQPIAFFYDNYTICEGEEVFMEVNEVAGYDYTWNSGQTGTVLEFTIERENLLEAGTHIFDVTIEDTATGCTNVAGPFSVIVHANPEEIVLVSNPDGFICDNEPVTISISNYDSDLTYVWNTGTIDATAIVVDIPGIYFVRGFNANGCETTSNEIEINKGPDINRIPSGCHRRCSPDTLCLPSIPGIVNWQWYMNDTPIPGPEGNQQEIIATESGDYYVEMLDEFGCEAKSGIMVLDLFVGTGTIGGAVFFDVNDNGIIDGPDTLMSNQTIFIEGDGFNDQIATNQIGTYAFEDILATAYNLYFDSLSLPLGWTVIQSEQQSELTGCDNINEINWLVSIPCTFQFGVESFNLCPGETMMYHDVELNADEIVEVVLQSYEGCDSIVTVTVLPLATSQDSVYAQACFEEVFEYNGVEILAGDQFVFEMTNSNGCDSNELLIVEMLLPTGSLMDIEICEDGMGNYNGSDIEPGESYEFTYVNDAGCDSIVSIIGVPIPLSFEEIQLQACQGDSVLYNDQYLYPNSIQEIAYVSFYGCDSVQQVTVSEMGAEPMMLAVEICPNETYEYNNESYEPGTNEIFSYATSGGCDSLVQLNVVSTPDFSFAYEAETMCSGELGEISIVNMQGSVNPYAYSMDGVNFQSESTFNNMLAGDYLLYVQDLNGCIKSIPATIPVFEELNISTENVTLVCDVDSIQLNAELIGGTDIDLAFTWPDGSTGTSFFAHSAGSYQVQASNICDDKTFEIVVSSPIDEPSNYLYVPNIFSPNGDGINDEFMVYPAEYVSITNYEIHVFDRWGEEEYYSTDINEGWDGKLHNGDFKPGVHVWWIKMDVDFCGDIRKGIFEKGDITVIR